MLNKRLKEILDTLDLEAILEEMDQRDREQQSRQHVEEYVKSMWASLT